MKHSSSWKQIIEKAFPILVLGLYLYFFFFCEFYFAFAFDFALTMVIDTYFPVISEEMMSTSNKSHEMIFWFK